ncbi:putative arabinosyltransferase ARAD1 [Bienertia sinuspersici]
MFNHQRQELLLNWDLLLEFLILLALFNNRTFFIVFLLCNEAIRPSKGAEVLCEKVIAKHNASQHVLRVFMYDLPPEFHFGLLDWKPEGSNVWPDIRTNVPTYPGGLNLQHSIEYWLTLDLLFSEYSGSSKSRIALRVRNSSEADVIFVPFFSSLSYNRFSRLRKQERSSFDKLTQDKLVQYIEAQEEWKKSGGNQLWPAMFILSDFGRYPPNIANVQKDIIAPYRHVIKSFVNDTSTYDSRPILLFFQGAIYRKDGGVIRQELYYLLKDEKDVHFTFGSIQRGGVNNATQGMHSSKFCLNIAGDTPSSNRLFDAIASHCVPVIISDDIELPYEDIIDYSEFLHFCSVLARMNWTRMWRKLQEIEKYFEYRYPSSDDDAVQMIWKSHST